MCTKTLTNGQLSLRHVTVEQTLKRKKLRKKPTASVTVIDILCVYT